LAIEFSAGVNTTCHKRLANTGDLCDDAIGEIKLQGCLIPRSSSKSYSREANLLTVSITAGADGTTADIWGDFDVEHVLVVELGVAGLYEFHMKYSG
jgi:hypothetical protein